MSGRFDGKTALVVAGAMGIGAAVVRRLAAEGATVVFGDVNDDEARKTVEALKDDGLTAAYIRCDGMDAASVEAAVAETVERQGRIDLVHANVGGVFGTVPDIADATDEQWDLLYQANLKAPFLAARAAIPHMLEQGKGAIVFTASISGMVAMPAQGVYGLMKAAIIQMTRSLAIDYATRGIRVNCVCPGPIDTGAIQRTSLSHPDPEGYLAAIKAKVPMGRMGEPREVAEPIAFLLSDDASFITGVALTTDGGLTAQ